MVGSGQQGVGMRPESPQWAGPSSASRHSDKVKSYFNPSAFSSHPFFRAVLG